MYLLLSSIVIFISTMATYYSKVLHKAQNILSLLIQPTTHQVSHFLSFASFFHPSSKPVAPSSALFSMKQNIKRE